MRNTLLAAMILLLVGCNADNNSKADLDPGYGALDAQQFDEAMARADQQLSQSPTGPAAAQALYLKGRALEQKTVPSTPAGKQAMTQARDMYHQALSQQPAPALEARLHAGIANTSYWLDDYPTAIQEWNAAYPNLDDAAVKSFVLYRIGICQQRLGDFSHADSTFATVQRQYPGTDAAKRAHEHQGYKGFTVQLATYANAASADAEIAKLRTQGMSPARGKNPQGNAVVSVGPVQTYAQALDMKNRLAASYPQAIILP
jgi:tetratricopeptide (TPR) repeat protein